MNLRSIGRKLGLWGRESDDESLASLSMEEPVEETPGLETVRRGSYYPVGLAPQQMKLTDPFAKTYKTLNLVRSLRMSGPGRHLVVADSRANILFNLWKKGGKKVNPFSDLEMQREAAAISRKLATFDRIEYDAIQDVVEEEETGGERVPVLLMSELLGEDYEALLVRVRHLCRVDAEFGETVYSLVPKGLRPRAHRKATLADLAAIPPDKHGRQSSYMEALIRMDYAIEEIAQSLYLQSVKLGHAGETGFDRLTIFAAQKLGMDYSGFRPVPFEVEGVGDENPYSVVKEKVDVTRESALSASRSMEMLVRDDSVGDRLWSEVQGTGIPELDFLRYAQALDAIAEKKIGRMDELEENFEFMNRIYTRMLERADELESELGTEVQEAIAARVVRQVVASLSTGPYPWLGEILEESGILSVLRGEIEVSDVADVCPFPFVCERLEGESAERYFLRFVNSFIHNNGFFFPPKKIKRWKLYWKEDGTRGGHYVMEDEQFGAFYSLRKLIHGLAKKICGERDLGLGGWKEDARFLFRDRCR